MVTENSGGGGGGGYQSQTFKVKVDFPEEWGVRTKKPSVERVWIFSGNTHFSRVLVVVVFMSSCWTTVKPVFSISHIKRT